jgi:hypothetical protein
MFVAVTLRGQGGNFIIVCKKLTTVFNNGIVMNDKPRILNDGFGSLKLRFLKSNADTFIVLVLSISNKMLTFVAVCVRETGSR